MGNGGSPPTHLPSYTDLGSLFPSFAFPIAAKLRQPPARAPEEFTAAFASQQNKEWDELVANAECAVRAFERFQASTVRANVRALEEERQCDNPERALAAERRRHKTERALARERYRAKVARVLADEVRALADKRRRLRRNECSRRSAATLRLLRTERSPGSVAASPWRSVRYERAWMSVERSRTSVAATTRLPTLLCRRLWSCGGATSPCGGRPGYSPVGGRGRIARWCYGGNSADPSSI